MRRAGNVSEYRPRMLNDLLGIRLDTFAVKCFARIYDQLDTLGFCLDLLYRTQYAVEFSLTAFSVDIE